MQRAAERDVDSVTQRLHDPPDSAVGERRRIEVRPADVDESDHPPDLTPAGLAEFLAAKKARAVAARFPNDVVLAADTVVALGDEELDAKVLIAFLSLIEMNE